MILKSLFTKVAIILLIGILLLVIGLGILLYILEYRNLTKNMNNSLDLTSKRLAYDLIEPLWNLNNYEANKMINFDMMDKNIISIIIKDENDKFFMGKIKDINNKAEDIDSEETYLKIKQSNKLMKKELIEKKYKIFLKLGYLEIYYTNHYVEIEIKKLIIRLFLLSLSLTLLMILIIFLTFRNFIIIPLRKIINLFKDISSGEEMIKKEELGKIIKNKSSDEIGELISSFNLMTKELASSYNKIECQNNELNKVKSYLNNIIESMPSALITIDENGIITKYNYSASIFFGKESDKTIGNIIWEIIPSFERYKKDFIEILQKHTKKEYRRVQIFNERDKYQNINFFPLVENRIIGIAIRIDDVTELERKNEQLIQAQKMETIGTLAGGIAHDFNNILGVILGSLSLLKFKVLIEEEINKNILKDYLNTMEEASNRASNIVKQLLSLSHKHELTMVPVDLNESLKHILDVCKSSFDKSIDINFKSYYEKAMIIGDSTQIEQVFLNLCINAYQAMTIMRKKDKHQGGSIFISIDKIKKYSGFSDEDSIYSGNDYWLICVKDTGVGIDKKIISKIFDPFFTTKEKDKGTGLGLSMVYNIIKKHKGFLNVYTEIDHGSSFNIYLPISKDLIPMDTENKEKIIEKGEGVILVVDDEKMMRKVAGDILTESGYEVIFASDGDEAVQIFKENVNKINCVLLDMVMPKKSGKECFIEIKKIKKDIKVILTSGFRKDNRVEMILKLGANDFIQKPYSFTSLAIIMKKILLQN